MADILEKITAYKREEVARAKQLKPLRVIAELARSAPKVRSFAGAIEAKLKDKKPALIAEIKKASPSKGLIRADFDPPALAKSLRGWRRGVSVDPDRPPVVPGGARFSHRRAPGNQAAGAAQGLHDRHLSGCRSARLGRRLHPDHPRGGRRRDWPTILLRRPRTGAWTPSPKCTMRPSSSGLCGSTAA